MKQPATVETPEPRTIGAGIDFTDPNSPLAAYYLQVGHVVAISLLALIFLFFNSLPLWHTDIWGHLKFGRWMFENKALPPHEPFTSFSDSSLPYVPFGWLGQAGFYAAFRAGEFLAGGDELHRLSGGVEMLRLVFALLGTARYALLLLAFWRLGGSMWLACLGVLVTLFFSTAHLGVLRPQLIGEVCFAGLLAMLSRPVLRRDLLVIPVLLAFWANAHGSFLVGLVMVGGCLAGRWIETCLAERQLGVSVLWRSEPLRRLFLVLVFSAAAGSLNPNGPWLYAHTLALSSHPNIISMDEWSPIPMVSPAGYSFLASLILIGLTAVVRRQWYTPTQTIVLLGFGIQAFFHMRMISWWVMVVPWVLVPHWATMLRSFPSLLRDHSIFSFRKTIVAGLIVLVAMAWSGIGNWLMAGGPRSIESTRAVNPATPWQLATLIRSPDRHGALPMLAPWLRQHANQGRVPGTIFASETLGDYLVWSLAPEQPVFAYAHVHLFSPERWRDFVSIKSAAPGWTTLLDRYKVNMLLFEADLFPGLRDGIRLSPDSWDVIWNEAGNPRKDIKSRLFIAVRKSPL